MDAATCVSHPGDAPGEGDLTLCIGCGHLYIRHDDRWIEPTVDEYFALGRKDKDMVEIARKQLLGKIMEDKT